jgi:PAS domain S-box-containing protein
MNWAKQSEEKFRPIISQAKGTMILMDEKGCVTLWNPSAEKIFGFTHEDAIGKDLYPFIMPRGYGEQMKKGFSHFIKSGQGPLIGNVIETKALHKSGHEFPISISVTSFKLNNEWNVAAIIRDITEQKTVQQKLLQSEEKEKRADELALANMELAFQNEEKEKRADELALANTELAFQNEEKEKRADELGVATKELDFQNEEKEKRAQELVIANKELAFQNEEKEKRANELIITNKVLAFQNEEKEKRADELIIANKELAFQNEEKEKRADELIIANKELAFQNEEKEKRADELIIANKELAFQNEEKEKRADELIIANKELAFQNEEKEKRADELIIANKELAFQNEEKEKRADELALANTEHAFQNEEKEKRADELGIANKELDFQNEEKEKRADELGVATKELDFQNEEKEKRAQELVIANKELAFQNEEKEKRADELIIANNVLAFQNEEKEKRADELIIANKELAFQNEEKEKRADELIIANKELAFQNEEKEKRADELIIANKELAFQNEEKEKRADELIIANKELAFQNEEKEKRADELIIANKELAFQNEEKEKRADELIIANKELAFQNEEKEKRADELIIANKELAFQNEEKEKRADELIIANKELAFQNEEKEKRADELALANTELAFQNKEKEKRADELAIANKELAFQTEEKQKRADKLILANKELAFQKKLDVYRSEMERVAHDLTRLIDTANAPIFGIDSKGLVNEWNQTSEKITGFKKEEVLGKDLVETYITEDYRKAVKQVLDNALKGKETANYEFPLFTKDNQRVMVLLNSSSRRNAAGKITGVLGVGQDISQMDNYKTNLEETVKKRTFELENSLEREKELGKIKTSFVAMASHEFRTPLAAIGAATDVILRYKDKLSQEDIDKRLFKVKREVSAMTIMLEDILIMGKSEVQKLEFNAIELDLVVLVKNIVADYQLTQEEEREVTYKISIDQTMLNADPKWIKHIIINLLSNALKYSEASTSIIIEIRQEEDEVILSVTDQGIGISEKDQKSLFEPFHRGENVGNIQGTGLGLSVLQTAIDLHKGKIKVESKLNNGSTFIVSIPYEGTI